MTDARPRSASAIGLVAAGVTALLAVSGALALAARAGTADPGARLLAQARAAATREDYVGVVRVEWRVGGEARAVDARVRSVDGVLDVARGPNRVVSRGPRRWESDDGRWSVVWGSTRPGDLPRPDRKWTLLVGPGVRVAGRPTTLVEAVDRETGDVRARFSLDRQTRLLLQREVLDRRGGIERRMRFLRIDGPGAAARTASVPRRLRAQGDERVHPARVGAPKRVGDGYRLAGTFRRPDGSVQLLYADGLFTVSVFEQDGALDWSALPAGGRSREVDGRRTRSYATPAGAVLVWEGEHHVLTGVTDGPADELDAIVPSFPGPDDHASPLDRAVDFVLSPFGWD